MPAQYDHRISMNRAFDTYIRNKHRLEFSTRDSFNFFSNPYAPIRRFSRFGMNTTDYKNDGDDDEYVSVDEITRARSRNHPYVSKNSKRRRVHIKIESDEE
jgi:hypothetical protein